MNEQTDRIAVIYERVSDKKQDLARQAVQRERAKADYPDREPLVLQDDGKSAYHHPIFDRPGGKRLCDLIEAGKVEALYVDAQDRLSRGKVVEWAVFADLCHRAETTIIIDGVPIDPDSEADEIVGVVKALAARRESREKAHRMRGSRRERAEAGKFGGGPIPYGYRQGERPGFLEEDPAEAALVRRIYEGYVAGQSQRAIAHALDREGHRTKRGGRWAQAIVRRILANPLYKGWGEQPALVTEEMWEEARSRREKLARTKGGGRGPMPKGRHLFLHGALRCGCGEPMIPRSFRGRDEPYEVYLCYGRVRSGTEACGQRPVPRAEVDEAVFDYFEAVTLDVAATREQVARAHDLRLSEAAALRGEAEREAMKAAEGARTLWEYVKERRVTPEEWREAREEQEAAEARADLLRAREAEVADEGSLVDADEAVLAHLARLRSAVAGRVTDAEGLDAVRAALLSVIPRFTYHDRDSEAAQTKLLDPDLFTGKGYLEPHPEPDAIIGYYESDYEDAGTISLPQLRRMPLAIQGDGDTSGFTT